ncbi:MAG: hypothetical protein PHH11_18040 [Methylomonas sp.]|nr:hypothetical protein [Methylomonas sp.]
MSLKKRNDTLLAALQQLCSLGLPSEAVMPDLLQGLSRWMSTDNGQFVWVDANQRPCKFYCDAGEANTWQSYLALFDHLTIPGWSGREWFRRNDRATLVGGFHDKGYYRSSFYGEVMSSVGGECSICIPIRDAGGTVYGSLGLNRDSHSHPFTDTERERYEQFAAHLSLLFSKPLDPDANAFERIGEQGMAIFDYAGELLYGDDTARQLLFLAGHSKLTGVAGTRKEVGVEMQIRRVCLSLQSIARGTPAAAPTFDLQTDWGRLVFSARLMSSSSNDGGAVGMDIVRYIPRRVAVWRRISSLDLPLRQRQVCLEFVENRSLSDIASLLGIGRTTVVEYVNKL